MRSTAVGPCRLKPDVEYHADCPECELPLRATGWAITGMRSLARAACYSCKREFYGDLPTGQALYSPMLLDPATGVVHDPASVPWFAGWLRDAYRDRSEKSVELQVESLRAITRPVLLLNCIDTLYGHGLLKLLNAQQYLEQDTFDVIVMVQPFLRWLVPHGVAECWTAGIPLRDGTLWSDAFAQRVATEAERFDALSIAPAFSHPHQTTFDISRFTRVAPYALSDWRAAPATGTEFQVSFIWRDDRCWAADEPNNPATGRRLSHVQRLLRGGQKVRATTAQRDAVIAMFIELRRRCNEAGAAMNAVVVGVGTPGDLPSDIADLRVTTVNESDERAWCRLYAKSHLVIGVHGSNMLLPSAHAGGVIELLPRERQGNFLQDVIFNGADVRDSFFRYRFVPLSSTADEVAELAAFMLLRYGDFNRLMGEAHSRDPGCTSDVRN